MSKLEFTCDFDDLSNHISELNSSSSIDSSQFGVEINGVLFPVFIHINSNEPERLTVLYNGAVSRDRAEDGIVFQRSSWKDEIPSSVVSFADPTLVLNEGMSIGWGQADGVLFAPEQYVNILQVLRESLHLPSAKSTLHFGSSAGGFQALATAAFDQGSRVLCNNPQTDFSQYSVAWATNRALKVNGFANRDEFLNSERFADTSWRIDIPSLYAKLNYMPEHIRFLVNTASKNDLTVQTASFISGITENSTEPTVSGYEVYYYYHPVLGHNPLPKAATLDEIKEQLGAL